MYSNDKNLRNLRTQRIQPFQTDTRYVVCHVLSSMQGAVDSVSYSAKPDSSGKSMVEDRDVDQLVGN
jgi:hypothetical protein